ncbi:hypothetical protein V6N12_009323 [Hibiscus sabdariffa]|uniref:Uncharacterized protein n=1 Tax=Hibiscus sabdariffa TaxID=183260 RepID=A0ABR2E9A4_9ROSI
MSENSVRNTVHDSNNVNVGETNTNIQDHIQEMHKLLQQRLRPMQERFEQLEGRYFVGQSSQMWQNLEYKDEYEDEVYEERAYERASKQHLRHQEPINRARPQIENNLSNIKIAIPPFHGMQIPRLI